MAVMSKNTNAKLAANNSMTGLAPPWLDFGLTLARKGGQFPKVDIRED
jgi:hypothetical protein